MSDDHSKYTEAATEDKLLGGELSEETLESVGDDYEIIIKDNVNWYLFLNPVESENNITRYTGILYYHYSGREITGTTKAVYNSVSDVLTAQCEHPYDEQDPDMMFYGLVFSSDTTYKMHGGWAYIKGKWQGGVTAQLLKGKIYGHLPKT